MQTPGVDLREKVYGRSGQNRAKANNARKGERNIG